MKTKSLYPYFVTADLEASVKFYTEALGFTVKHKVERAIGGYVYILSDASGHDLELMDEAKTDIICLKAGEYGLRMNVDDIDAAAEELKAKGYQTLGAPQETKVGKNLFLKDPNGTVINLVKHIHKD